MTAKDKFLCIPEIGTQVRLEEDWTFALYNEHRNRSLIEIFHNKKVNRWGMMYDSEEYGKPVDFITLSAGTELSVERVYIRCGLRDFSSITFLIKNTTDSRFFGPGKGKNKTTNVLKKARFWAKLADVNMSKMLVIKDMAADETQE